MSLHHGRMPGRPKAAAIRARYLSKAPLSMAQAQARHQAQGQARTVGDQPVTSREEEQIKEQKPLEETVDEFAVARAAAAFFHLCIDAVCKLFLAFARVANLFYVLISEAVADTHNHELS